MTRFITLASADWGHSTSQTFSASDLIGELRTQIKTAIENYGFTGLEDAPATHPDFSGFVRVEGLIPITAEFFDAFFHGPSGYRAQYAKSIETGERFNACVVAAINEILLPHNSRYAGGQSADFVAASLSGVHSKVWFPKDMTDYANSWWYNENPVIKWPQWVDYWSLCSEPPKGLFAYSPPEPAILVNGTFLHPAAQKIGNPKLLDRSQQIHQRGWT